MGEGVERSWRGRLKGTKFQLQIKWVTGMKRKKTKQNQNEIKY